MEVKPIVFLEFEGPGGNVFAILGACERAAKDAGWPKETIEAFMHECKQADYEHVLDMVFDHFDVQQVVKTAVSVDRQSV